MANALQHPAAKHLSDEQILLLAEDELSWSDAACARAHLEACQVCRERRGDLEESLDELMNLRRISAARSVELDPGARAKLQMQMRGMTAPRSGWMAWLETLSTGSRRYAVYASLLVLLGGMMFFLRRRLLATPSGEAMFAEQGGVPNHSLTPGATRPVALADICPLGDDDLDPAVPAATQRVVFEEYGIAPDATAKKYQVDYLINPQLGGTNDVRNLWPEPYTSTVWNAQVKDALEDRLHEMVCAQTIDLASAQRDIATDWISAYKKYFHTPKPV
jgi:hypothetical protein